MYKYYTIDHDDQRIINDKIFIISNVEYCVYKMINNNNFIYNVVNGILNNDRCQQFVATLLIMH